MFYLILSILFSSILFVIFKLFDRFKINTLQAILVNYVVAGSIGIFLSDAELSILDIPNQPWFLGAFFLGVLFITIFNVMGLTAQLNGLSVASVASKMSVIIPIIFAVSVYSETLTVLNIVGIILALIAVYLTSFKEGVSLKSKYLLYPILLFFGSGAIDTSLKYIQKNYVAKSSLPLFSTSIFGFAFCLGMLYFLVQSYKTKEFFKLKNVIGGIILGIPNYFSIDCLLRALQYENLESSVIFTVNNVSIVLFSTLLGFIIFKEKLVRKNWLGIILAIISIILVTIY